MNYAALTVPTLASTSAIVTPLITSNQTVPRNDESAANAAPSTRGDSDALRQMLMNANEIAVSADANVAGVDLSSNPIELAQWTALFAAVNERIAGTVALMSSQSYWRNDLPGANSARTVMFECAEALTQLRAMFPLCQPELTPVQQELVDTRAALAFAQAALAKSQMQERISRHVALHDALTLLPNRTFLMWHLKHALAEALIHQGPVAVLYLDLDGLKPVNDQHGHHVGDAMLQTTARRLRDTVPQGVVVGRLGGDEFVCLLTGMKSRNKLAKLAESLMQAVSAELLIGERRVAVRPSIGIAISEGDSATPETLLKHADAAMYRAKRSQAGYVFWDFH